MACRPRTEIPHGGVRGRQRPYPLLSQTSIRQADCVLMVGIGDEPAMGEYVRLLLSVKTTARKELVLLSPRPQRATWLDS